jgi:hypothetical protein
MAELQVDGASIQSAIKAKFTLNAKSGWYGSTSHPPQQPS